LWLFGLAVGVSVLVLSPEAHLLADRRADQFFVAGVGWSFIGSGLIVWRRRPGIPLGALMVGVGFLWFSARLAGQAPWSPVFTAGMWLSDLWVAAFAVFVVCCSQGRLTSRVDRLLVAPFVVAFVPLELLWLLFFDPVFFDPSGGAPENALLVWRDAGVADAVDWTQRALAVGGSVVLIAALSRRWLAASPPRRRSLTPIWAGAAAILLNASLAIWFKVGGAVPPQAFQWILLATWTTVPLAVLVDILRARLARSAVGELVVELSGNPAPTALRDALARALGDPSLTLAYWLPEYETYADLDGRPIALRPARSQTTTVVDRGGKPAAALLHDASLREDPTLLDAVVAAAGIALENARLHAELRARLEELRGSRARIVEAAQTERSRLERDLHDGAQQRLVSLSLELGLLETRFEADPAAKRSLEQARREVGQSLVELRELARGIHPAVVTGHGLDVALETLVARAPLPVRLSVVLDGRLSEAIAVAAYYLVSESLTNVAKHAQASSATVEVTQASGELVVEVVDDGVGGANTDTGSGLRGLADRVEALGGRLRVWSPAGRGTRVRAEVPCA
jgi:signal transduction histidine kinase